MTSSNFESLSSNQKEIKIKHILFFSYNILGIFSNPKICIDFSRVKK